MSDNFNGYRKEIWNQDIFRSILKEALDVRPEVQRFDPKKDESVEVQIEKWKANSAERRGFDTCFQMITGHRPEDLL